MKMLETEIGNFIISNLDWIWLTMLACTISATAQRQNGTDYREHTDMQTLDKTIAHMILSLTFSAWFSLYFDEAVVKGEIVSERVLPPLCVFSVVWKVLHDPLVDSR